MTTAYHPENDVILTDSSILFAQSWYNMPASQGLIEIPAPIKGCIDLTNKERYFEATSSESQENIDVADLAPPIQHSSTIPPLSAWLNRFPPFSVAQNFLILDMAQLSSSLGMARAPSPFGVAQPSFSFGVARSPSSLGRAQSPYSLGMAPSSSPLMWLDLLSFYRPRRGLRHRPRYPLCSNPRCLLCCSQHQPPRWACPMSAHNDKIMAHIKKSV